VTARQIFDANGSVGERFDVRGGDGDGGRGRKLVDARRRARRGRLDRPTVVEGPSDLRHVEGAAPDGTYERDSDGQAGLEAHGDRRTLQKRQRRHARRPVHISYAEVVGTNCERRRASATCLSRRLTGGRDAVVPTE
jgi:hypothetical protein